MGALDQKQGVDPRAGKKKDKEGLAPGKVAGTDNYGQGGNGVNAAVPGKAAASQNLPAGSNGQPGKENGVDAKDGTKKEPNQAGGGKGQPKETAAADAKDGGKGKGAANADHNAAAGGKADGKKAAAQGGPKTAAKRAAGAAAVAGTDAKHAGPLYQAKTVAPAQKVDAPAINPVAPVKMAALPPVNKNLVDKWIKETGRSPEAHHAEIQSAVAQLTSDVQSSQNDLQTYLTSVTNKVQGELDQRTSAFASQVTTPGRARVAGAYSKMKTAVETSSQKALADIQTHKQSGAKTINTTTPAKKTEVEKKLEAVKNTVKAKVEQHAPAAKKELQKFATELRPLIEAKKLEAISKAAAEVTTHDPSKHSADTRDPGGALEQGKQALRKDVYKQLITAEGKKLGDEYQSTLSPVIDDIEKNAPGWVILAIQDQIGTFNGVLDIYRKDTGEGVTSAGKNATDDLNAQEASAKKAVADAKTATTTKINTEEKSALEAADAAGKELLDNSKNAGAEFVDRLKKKAATDAQAYATVTASIEKTLQKKGPHRFEQLQPQIAAAKAQLLKMHEANKQSLDQMVASGMTDLTGTLAKFQSTYTDAIKNREESASRYDAEIKKDVAKGASDLGAHVSGIGTTMQDTVTKELAKIDGAVTTFNVSAETALGNFTTQLKDKVDKIQIAAQGAFEEGLKKPFGGKEELVKTAEEQIKAKEKAGVTDAGKLRGAFDGYGTDEEAVFSVLRSKSYGEVEFVHGAYNHHYDNRGAAKEFAGQKVGEDSSKSPLKYDIDDEMSGSDYKIAMAYLDHHRDEAIQLELKQAQGGFFGTDGKRVETVLRTCSDEEIHKLNTDPKAQQIVMMCRVTMFDQCNGDVMTTLLDEKITKEERASKADAIRLFDAMKGCGTDEAKMTEIFEAAQTPEQRAALRKNFNDYAARRGWETGTPGDENNDALALAIKDDTSGGEQALFLEQAKVQRDDGMVKMAKAYKAADGGGTDESLLLDSLDDEKYAKEWEDAKPEDRPALEAAHKKLLDARLATITGTAKKDKDGNVIGTTDKSRGDIDGLIEDETNKCPFTWQELLDGKKASNGEAIDTEQWKRHLRTITTGYLEYLCIQRTRQIGKLDPNIALAYACWGVSGTDEELINKAISKGGEPLAQKDVLAIKRNFHKFWGVKLVDNEDEFKTPTKDPGGLLSAELGGKDWFKTRILLCGVPENARQEHYVNNLRFDYASSGALGGVFMDAMEAVGATEAKSTAEHSRKREQEFYTENFQKPGIENTSYEDIRAQAKEAQEPDAKDPSKKKDPKEVQTLLKNAANVEEFLLLSKEMEIDAEAYATTKSGLIDAVITCLEVIGGVIISVATMGAGSPILAAFLANLAMSAGGIVLKALVKGDQYGAGDAMSDGIAALGSAGFGALGEAKAVVNAAEGIGKRLTGTVFRAAEEGLEKGGMQVAKVGGKWGIELSKEGMAKVQRIVAAGAKNVMMSTGQEIYGFVTDEKTYEMKFGEALWGENSLGKRILAGAPKAFATGAVTTWINEAAHTSTLDYPKGTLKTANKNALWNAVAEMGGNTAGFFLYPDNYQNAEHFWQELFKSNLQSGLSGYASGYLMHKNRHKKLGAEFIRGDLDHDGLMALVNDKTLDQLEQQKLAQFVMAHGTDAAKAALPKHYKDLIGAKITLPVMDADGKIVQPPGEQHANNNAPVANANENTAANTQAEPAQQQQQAHKDEAAKQAEAQKQEAQKKIDETKNAAPENQPATQQTQVSHEEKPAVVANENVAPAKKDEHKQNAPVQNEEMKQVDTSAAPVADEQAAAKAKTKNDAHEEKPADDKTKKPAANANENAGANEEVKDAAAPQNENAAGPKQLKVGASLEHGVGRRSVTPDLIAETTNAPETLARANAQVQKLPKHDQPIVQHMLDTAESPVHKTMLERAVAAGRSRHEIDALRAEMAGMTADDVARTFTGAGVVQFYHGSCVPTSYQIAIADVDPFYAFQLRVNPEMVMDQQRAALQKTGGAQAERKEVAAKKSGQGVSGNLGNHLDDEHGMGKKLLDPNSYDAQGTHGIDMRKMEGQDLHAQLEAATGHKYEIITHEQFATGDNAGPTYAQGATPHERIIAALDKGLPVIIGEVKSINEATNSGDGHAQVIIGHRAKRDGTIEYIIRDPMHGNVRVVGVAELEMMSSLSNVVVPVVQVPPGQHVQTTAKAAATNEPPHEFESLTVAGENTPANTDANAATPKPKRTPEEIAARKEEVAKARAETAARDKALTDEIHNLAPAKTAAPKPGDPEPTGPAPAAEPVDVPKVFDNITIGGGFAAVANQSSHPTGGENSIMIAAGANPWDKATNRFGQPVGESEVPNAKAGHKMKETASDPDARFMLASEHAENVALNRNDHELRTYPGQCGAVEAKDPATWPQWALDSGANVRIPVMGPDNQLRYFYAKGVDVAAGPGPARQLKPNVLDPATLKKMQEGKAFFFGDQSFTGNEIQPGDNVVNYGGGASAAWGTEAASKNAASVDWVARHPDKQHNDPALEAKRQQLHSDLMAARGSKDPERIKQAEAAMQKFAFEEAERNGFLPRNREPGGAFDPTKQAENGGNITRRTVDDCTKIDYVEKDGKMQVELTFVEKHPDGSVHEVKIYKDKMILSIGQDATGAGGPVGLVENYKGKLLPILGPAQPPDGFQPVLGVQSPDGAVRVLGAAATPREVSAMLDPAVMSSNDFQANLVRQAESLPADSKGVFPGFAMQGKNIELANHELAKKIQQSKEEQRREAGLPAEPAKVEENDPTKPKTTLNTSGVDLPPNHDEEHHDKPAVKGAAKDAQENHPTRKQEIHLHNDTPAKPPAPAEATLRKELDELFHKREALKKAKPGTPEHDSLKKEITERVGHLDAKLKDPKNKDSYLDPHVAFAIAREANFGESKELPSFLRKHVDEFRKSQDQGRQGADPQLRAKREVFEREVAKQVLSGSVKEKVDANLKLMSDKAVSYIEALPADQRDAAYAKLGAVASGGYAGAVLPKDAPVAEQARIMREVLKEGNVRERMIALGNFPAIVAGDMHNNPSQFNDVVAKSKGGANEFNAEDAERYRKRMEMFKADQEKAGADPKGKKYLNDFLKPVTAEKEGSQLEYQTAKNQEMDTKFPSLPTLPQESVGLFHNPLPQSPNKDVAQGQTGTGESSSLARSKMTIKEAEAMGYELSPREIAAAKANGDVLPWVIGTVANVVDPSAGFIKTGAELSMPQKAGISGTTFRFMEAAELLGGKPMESRLAMIGALQVIDAHTIYEIASAAKGFGVEFNPQRPYENLGIPPKVLEDLALKSGTTLSELNGETKANAPAATNEPAAPQE